MKTPEEIYLIHPSEAVLYVRGDVVERLQQERDQLKEKLAVHQRMLAGGILYSYRELAEHDADVIMKFITQEVPRFDLDIPIPLVGYVKLFYNERERIYEAANQLRQKAQEQNQ